jgi:hypothetical protein
MTKDSSRRALWTPPARPEWVARINAEGAHLDIKSIVPLDSASLLTAAMANTGLSDFGSDDWREPFEIICKGLDTEAGLNLMGRILTRTDMLMLLEGRLRVEDAYKRHPEIEDEQIVAPMLIIGQGRSGTSALQNLLALDPENATTKTWQAMFPGLGGDVDQQIATADARVKMWARVTPEMNAVHEWGADVPTECIHLYCMSFQAPSWQNIYGQNPSHYQYMATRNYVQAISYEKRILKLLQWRQPNKRWVLKSPDSLNYLPDILQVYPDIRLVWPHRDPVVALASVVSLVGTLAWVRSDQVMTEGTFEAVSNPAVCAEVLSRPIDWIESGVLPEKQLCNIQYDDFIADPLGTVEDIYNYFGQEFSAAARAAMQAHIEQHPRSERPAHRYDTGDSEIVAAERLAFKRYQDFFKIPNAV